MPNLFAGISRAARTVDADNDSFHIVVFAQFLEVCQRFLCGDAMLLTEAHSLIVVYLTIGIIDGNLLVHLVTEIVTCSHIGECREGQVVIFVQLKTSSQSFFHVAQIANLIGKLVLHIYIRFTQQN